MSHIRTCRNERWLLLAHKLGIQLKLLKTSLWLKNMTELVTTIRETVTAEIEENLVDLRNDIVNIHSEMIVITSLHSDELGKVLVNREKEITRLQEENKKLRVENDNFNHKHSLLSQ